MLEALRFVQGAVAAKELIPELTHFRLIPGYIMGFNGVMSLCSPIDLELTAAPKAVKFTKAIAACKDPAVAIKMTANGRLSITSGKLRAYIECLPDYAFDYYPTGDTVVALPTTFLDSLKAASAFSGEDASRPWCRAVHMENQCLYATNNIVAVQSWFGVDTPPLTLPDTAVRELLRIKQPPTHLQTDGNSVSFHYENKRWLRTQLISEPWPVPVFDKLFDESHSAFAVAIPDGLRAASEQLSSFDDGPLSLLYLAPDSIRTHLEPTEGAQIFVETGVDEETIYLAKALRLVLTVATGWNPIGRPVAFVGDRLRGIVLPRDR